VLLLFLLAAGTAVAAPPVTTQRSVATGATVLLAPASKSAGCARGVLPDRRCSPGAYDAGLTAAVVCSASFRTGSIRHVSQATKEQVEREYGLPGKLYGRSIEIDHIVPLELGGSNVIANLYPEPGSGAHSYHEKDILENRLHAMVCAEQIRLRDAQARIAANWRQFYATVFR
jgi:hypothetical protein